MSPHAAWAEERYTIGGPMPVTVHIGRDMFAPRIRIHLTLKTTDRSDPRLTTVVHIVDFVDEGLASRFTPEQARDFVHALVRGLWLHELEEQFHCDGVRCFDPHAREAA